MPLTKLQFRPGIIREVTSYTNEGGWFNCDKIRFKFGMPEKLGGWQKKSNNTFTGLARALKAFVALDGSIFTGVGTTFKYYIESGGEYNDITPLRETTSAGAVTFAATNGSSTLTVTDSSHGAIADDFVTFSGAATLGGNITAAVLNQEYQIVSVPDGTTYTISAKDPAGSAVTANSSDSGNGGASVVGAYQINTGLNTTVIGTGWGAGTWSRNAWGSASASTVVGSSLRLWSHDNFGEDLIFNVRDGGIYYWDKSTSFSPIVRAVTLASRTTDTSTHTVAKNVIVYDVNRHIIVFGCDDEATIGVQDPLLIRFSAQGDPTTWQSLATNSAGELRLGSGSEIITAVETRQQILVYTDASLHAMQFLGPPFTFGLSLLSENITIMSPNAAKAMDDAVFWMGLEEFYVYTGQVQKLPCPVLNYVFEDFNHSQSEKVFAALNTSFNEIWWFYPSLESEEIDRYVVYNHQEKVWYYGNMARTAWLDRGITQYPIAAATDYRLYNHEYGIEDGESETAITAFIESSQVDIGEGEQFSFIRRMIPDVAFAGSTSSSPVVDFTLKTRNFPGADYSTTNTSSITRSTTIPIEQYTTQANVRLRGRSMALKIQSDTQGVQWKLGSPRVEIRPDGRR